MEDLIQAHLNWCAVDCAPETVTIKGIVLRAAHRDLPHGLEATHQEISAYLANGRTRPTRRHPAGKPWAPKNKSAIFAHLKIFFDWAVAHGELDYSPMGAVRRPKVPAGEPNPWTADQLGDLLRYAVQPFRLAVVLAAYAGLRCCEIVQLAAQHRRVETVRYRDERGAVVAVESELIRITGKGGKTADVEVHERVRAELAHFPGAAPYIVQAGGRADAHWLSREAGRYFRHELGLHVTLHQGRHWFTTGVYEENEDLRAAQAAARHSSVSTTQGYAALRNGQRRRGILALPVLDAAA